MSEIQTEYILVAEYGVTHHIGKDVWEGQNTNGVDYYIELDPMYEDGTRASDDGSPKMYVVDLFRTSVSDPDEAHIDSFECETLEEAVRDAMEWVLEDPE